MAPGLISGSGGLVKQGAGQLTPQGGERSVSDV